MSEMVERVAKAIRKFVDHPDQTDWYTDQEATEAARAAIAAMREPTMPMLHAAYRLMDGEPECQCMNPGLYVEWKTMIDEALK